MPYKFNEARRHKIPKAKYRVTNWPDYDAALVRRGSLTVWVTEEAIAAWHAPATGKRGGQPVYSDLAIETGLTLRLVLRLGLRQIEGTLGSIAHLLGVDIRIPDHTTFSRRAAILILTLCRLDGVFGVRRQGGAASGRDWWRLCKGEGEEQILPRREDQVGRDRRQLVEEIVAWPKRDPCGAPEFVADVADGMDRERQQVQAHQDGCEIVLPVSETVLKVVALVLQNVERLILDLPPCPATGGEFDDSVGTDGQIGDEAVAIGRLALGVDDLDLE